MRAFLLAGCALLFLASLAVAQRGQATPPPALPPIVLTCPHHPEVIESKPGTCPFCKMTLVSARLASAWTCPVHPSTLTETPGTCPICRRQLVPVTVELTWTCPGSKDAHLEPGQCANGSARALTRTPRAHGDHNPRHGGQFFMASDYWHHVEGAYPSPGMFRLYFYDDYTRPLPVERLRIVRARVTREQFDPATRTTVEQSSAPLRVATRGNYLEARIDPSALPANVTAKVQFTAGSPEQRFDFAFPALTRDPAPAAAPRAAQSSGSKPAAPAAPRPPATAPPEPQAPSAPTTSSSQPDPALLPLPIPDTVSGILDQLRTRNQQIAGLIDRGELTAVWVPTFYAKDLCLALEKKLGGLDQARRDDAAAALQRAVRLAWLLDAHGDLGNRQNVATAYAAFSTAIGDVLAEFAERPR